MDFKKQQQDAFAVSADVIKKVASDFKKSFGRSYGDGMVESYLLDDAKYVFVGLGTICGTARLIIDKLRKEGKKVGMLKLKCFRPFPEKELVSALNDAEAVAVFDRAVSFGQKGPVFSELESAFCDEKNKPIISSFIAGLGGRDVKLSHIEHAFDRIMKEKQSFTEWLL
jgi:pyruvate ferredoxin oxidoreductase alpha subunit